MVAEAHPEQALNPNEKKLARIRAGLSLCLMHATDFEEMMMNESTNPEALQRNLTDLATGLGAIESQAKKLELDDPTLMIPRDLVNALVNQASSGEAFIAQWFEERRRIAEDSVKVAVDQANSVGNFQLELEKLFK